MNKKGNAVDFLCEWGWAFLVILITLGSLTYFGVFDPTYTVEDCIVFCDQENLTCGVFTQDTVTCYPEIVMPIPHVYNWSGEKIGFD